MANTIISKKCSNRINNGIIISFANRELTGMKDGERKMHGLAPEYM